MYILKEFNQRHARDIYISHAVYLGVISVTFFGLREFLSSPTALLSFTLIYLALAHCFRLVQLSKRMELRLSSAQILVLALSLLVILFLISYAYYSASRGGFSSDIRTIFLPLVLISIASTYSDLLLLNFKRPLTTVIIATFLLLVTVGGLLFLGGVALGIMEGDLPVRRSQGLHVRWETQKVAFIFVACVWLAVGAAMLLGARHIGRQLLQRLQNGG
ncbi:MAG TPA: hypothetical protein VJL90_03075 [Pseudorhodoplanes sp.]|nr:hypothetical protein [Pseudorhodoplanes sp.]